MTNLFLALSSVRQSSAKGSELWPKANSFEITLTADRKWFVLMYYLQGIAKYWANRELTSTTMCF